MEPFAHLHVHTEYSLLDGQCKISRLWAKAAKDNMPGFAITDHGNMFGIKEFFDLAKKENKGRKAEGLPPIKPIFGCEVYVAHRTLAQKEGRQDQSGWHLILLAKNMTGYKNLIKIVSKAYTEGFYMRPRTDRVEIEKYHEGLICCSACIGGEVPRHIREDRFEEAEEAIRWYKSIFGDDYYLELQLHKATVERANHEAYHVQLKVNEYLKQYADKYGIKLVCTNDVHFVEEEHAEAHDRLICLGTGKDLDDPKRMLYSKQEWMKTTAEMAAIFEDVPEALDNTIEVCNKVESYSIDHAPIMPTFAIPEDFGTEEGYRQKYTEQDLFDEFTRDENGNVVMSEGDAKKKIDKLGGYDKLYRIKLEADYLAKLAMDGAHKRYAAAVVAAIGTFFFSILFKFLLPDVPFLLRMGYVFACLVVLFFSISMMSKKTVKAAELDEHTIKTQMKWSNIILISSVVCLCIGIASMFSHELRCYGFEAIFFLALILFCISFYLRSNAKDKVEDPKSIGVDIAIFRTDKAFNIGAIAIIVILTILYIALW